MDFRKYLSEIVGTFGLIFCGCGAIIVNQETGGVITHTGVAITWGLIVAVLIFALGDVSGAHINPAVTLSFAVAGRFPAREVVPYILAQAVGAFAGTLVLRELFPENEFLGGTLPTGDPWRAFVLEAVMTMLLVMVVFNVSTGAKEKGITAAIAIGSMVGLEALFAGPISGTSLNPIRSLSPAVVSGHTEHLWVYLTAPFVGAALGVGLHQVLYSGRRQ